MEASSNEWVRGKIPKFQDLCEYRRLIVAVRSGALTAAMISCLTRGVGSASQTAHYARKSRRRLGDCAACGHFITDRSVSALAPPRRVHGGG